MDYTPKRVVSLQPSATVILRDLGRLSALVACTKYCVDVCGEISREEVAIVADSWTAQAAQISQLRPDLVIASVPKSGEGDCGDYEIRIAFPGTGA